MAQFVLFRDSGRVRQTAFCSLSFYGKDKPRQRWRHVISRTAHFYKQLLDLRCLNGLTNMVVFQNRDKKSQKEQKQDKVGIWCIRLKKTKAEDGKHMN